MKCHLFTTYSWKQERVFGLKILFCWNESNIRRPMKTKRISNAYAAQFGVLCHSKSVSMDDMHCFWYLSVVIGCTIICRVSKWTLIKVLKRCCTLLKTVVQSELWLSLHITDVVISNVKEPLWSLYINMIRHILLTFRYTIHQKLDLTEAITFSSF